MTDFDIEFDDSYWQSRCEESERMVYELVEWIETFEDELSFDEDTYNLIARAKEIGSLPND